HRPPRSPPHLHFPRRCPAASPICKAIGATPYIEALADREGVKGFEDGTYRPDAPISRAQFAALVATNYGAVPMVRPAVPFVDVSSTFWAYGAIDQAQRRGFVGGYPDQTYRPNQPMTRVQAFVAVANGLELPAAPASVLGVYGDRAQIPSYGINALAAATQAGLVINHPNPSQLRPQEAMTRAEVAVLIYQGLVALGDAPALAASQAVIQLQTVQGSFPDIQTHWAKDFMQGLLNANLLRGQDDGRFYPDSPMPRAQFAALISSAFNPPPRRSTLQFWDVPASHWAASPIQTAYRAGFLTGFPDGSFAPDNSILRVQVWVALVNGLGLLANQVDTKVLNRFRDRATLPTYALDAVAKATRLGLIITVPDASLLHPNRVASRADVAAAVYQTLALQNRMPALSSPYIVRP
ncbi:MAG: S-layer homology domain-containing protein, partial [Leptolyngbyaceae cyanobacterium SM2_5_2]|nr:S-layer homology domain-containing protein [Leptolyngbyaceae cyanobacterium SM2_5_2]